jgi:hypothetical protein
MSTFDIIAPASLLAKDRHFNTHAEWVRSHSAKASANGTLEKAWNGKIKGKSAKAYIESSRWLANCPYCGRPEAVDPNEKFMFCFSCNMEANDYEAAPVEFPDIKTVNEITAALMERPMKYLGGPTKYERIVRMQPLIVIERDGKRFGLGRNWDADQTVEDLHEEQDELIRIWKER